MKQLLKKIYTVLVLIKNVIFRRRKYTLSFEREGKGNNSNWYYVFKHWGFSKGNLLMVSGADTLCSKYSYGKDHVTVNIVASKMPDISLDPDEYDDFVGSIQPKNFKERILYGRTYVHTHKDKKGNVVVETMWICPVTLFVLGRYPNYIYIKHDK